MKLDLDQIKLALAGVLAVALALGIGRFAYTPILPFMRESLGLTSSEAGLIASWNYFGYLIGSLSILFPLFNYRLKLSFILACVTSIASTGLISATVNFDLICLTRFINGFCGAIVLISGTSLIFSKLENYTSLDLRLAHFSGFGLGMAVSSIGVIICSNLNIDWRGQWIFMLMICLIFFIPTIKFIPDQSETILQSKKIIGKNDNLSFFLLCLGYACFGFGYIIYGTFIADLIHKSDGLMGMENIAWLVAGIAAIPSAIFWQRIAVLTSLDRSLLFSSVISALGAILLLIIDNSTGILISCFLYGFGIPGIVALTLLEGKRRYNGNVTAGIAILTTSFSVGQILGPYISGNIIDYYGNYFYAISASGIFLTFGGILMLRPSHLKKQNIKN